MYGSAQTSAAVDGTAAGVSVQVESSDASVSASAETIQANLVEVGVGPL